MTLASKNKWMLDASKMYRNYKASGGVMNWQTFISQLSEIEHRNKNERRIEI